MEKQSKYEIPVRNRTGIFLFLNFYKMLLTRKHVNDIMCLW